MGGQVFNLDIPLFYPINFRMARPLRIEYPGTFFHITSRGAVSKASRRFELEMPSDERLKRKFVKMMK